jgi:O-antigen/teichoic acid export membrane protein
LLITFSGKSIAKNTIFNLLGYGIPILFAIVFIPLLIEGLGKERFGVLILIWTLIGYSSFIDLGLGRSLTKVVAEKIGLNQTDDIPVLFWSSLFLMFVISLLVSIILILFLPSTLNHYLNISFALKPETYKIFYAVLLSFPIITTTSALRGVLEAHQKFYIVNIIRAILGVATFGIPLIVLNFINSLFWIVLSLIFIRVIIWFTYLIFNLKLNRNLRSKIQFSFQSTKSLLKFGLWISLANIIGPLVLYSDKFLIGTMISAVAITYYATPFEMITKLLVISSALVTVLFPIFSASFISNPELSKKIFVRAVKYIFIIVYPLVLVIIIFANEIMSLWLGQEFAIHSYRILQYLAIGILLNSLSLIPNIFFQGTGKPHIPALLNIVQLPFYMVMMWLMINKWGIIGAAITYMLMAMVDATAMYVMSFKIFSISIDKKYKFIMIIPLIFLFLSFQFSAISNKFIFIGFVLFFFSTISWKYLLSKEERILFSSRISNIIKI